ncbi:interaptin isoform X2 [Pseudorasbora parva]|uniref:interaptin isoform X2 n=1 Tax=Pseudorasbora parva TaxID=51549 RepID=UPI00351DE237
MIKARRAMKRIQPFTIGTKLSVPSEAKCLDYVGIILPVPGLDCCELRNDSNNDNSPFHQERESTYTPLEGLSDDIKEEDDRDSVSPSASSRSIRKIAMCANAESQINCHVTDFNVTNCEANKPGSSAEKLFLVEERLSDKSGAQLETDPWTKGRKIRNLHYDYSMPTVPEDAAHSQRRDLKDIENSLIQLTTSLDLMQEEPERPLQNTSDAVDLELEMFRTRQSPGDHVDKSWLKLRSLLRDYHQDLMLALDVSSFYQQADSIIGSINWKRNHALVGEIQKSDKETREIACQINMLNESASRLSTLHPTLARRVTCKQSEVKENWALLQEFLRNQKTDVSSKRPSTLPADPLTTCPDSQSFARNEGHSIMGKDVKEEQNRLRGFECSQGLWAHRMWSPVEECSVGSRGSLLESSCSKLDNISEKQDRKSCIGQMAQTTSVSSQECFIPKKLVKESMTSTGMNEEHDCLNQRQDRKIEELLSQVEVLWDALQTKYGENNESEPTEKEQTGDKAAQMLSELTLSNHLTENVEGGSSGMLEKFLELLDPSGYHKKSQNVSGPLHRQEMAEDAELHLLSPQSVQERSQKQDQTTDELQSSLSTLTLRINQHLCRCAELSMDLLDIETDMAVLCDSDLSGLEGIQEQQDDLEAHYTIIESEVREMERLSSQLQFPSPEEGDPLREEVQAILQAWEEVGRNMAENRGRLEKFHQIQHYFENYLAMITWTENTRSCLLAGSSAWRESEIAEIDHCIETKLDEFSKLAAAGQELMKHESQFKDIIKDRTDELKSMLGWIQVNWHAQRKQFKRNKDGGPKSTNYPVQQQVMHFKNPSDNLCIINREVQGGATETRSSQNNFEQQRERHDVSSVVNQESCLSKTSLGSSICLILTFDEQSSGINQVTKQWSPNNIDIHEESSSSIQADKHQSQDKNSMKKQMQQPHDMLQVKWPNESIMSKETKLNSSCWNLGQLQNKEPVKSLGKQKVSSLLSSCDTESSFSGHSTENLQSINNQSDLQLSPDTDQVQKLLEISVTHQAQNPQSPSYNQYLTRNVAHNNLETNQNQSDDHLRHEVAAEVTHRVFTYLHVSDSYRSAGRVLEVVSPPCAEGQDMTTSALSSSSDQSASSFSQNVTAEGGMVYNPNRFKASSVFKMKEPIRSKEDRQRRNSTLGNVRLERSGKSSSIFRRRCNTWPERERRLKESHSNSNLQVFIKKNMLPVDSVIDNKSNPFPEDNLPNAVKTSSGAVKNICSYLSLGSTLSFSLPKRFHNSVLEMENKKETEPIQIYDSNNQTLPSTQTPQLELEVEPVTHMRQAEINLVDMEHLEDTEDPEVENQQLNQVYESTEPVLRDFTLVEYEEPINDSSSFHKASPPVVNGSPLVSQSRLLCPSSSCGHSCFSVHTKIKDLNGHLYYTSKYMKINSSENLFPNGQGSGKSSRIINCGVRDCAVCFSDTVKETRVDCAEKPDIRTEELLQPGHWLFQQEEEELEDIWRGKVGLSIKTSMGQVAHPLHG